jgi:hypothetical protein
MFKGKKKLNKKKRLKNSKDITEKYFHQKRVLQIIYIRKQGNMD